MSVIKTRVFFWENLMNVFLVMRNFLAIFALGCLLTLSACSSIAPIIAMNPNFVPTSFKFDVQAEYTQGKLVKAEYTVTNNSITFITKPGSIGGHVNGYEIEYLNPLGQVIGGSDSVFNNVGSMNVVVPPGITCLDNEANCTINSSGVKYTSRTSETVDNVQTLPVSIAREIYLNKYNGAWARVYFHGFTDLNQKFVSGPHVVGISYTFKETEVGQ